MKYRIKETGAIITQLEGNEYRSERGDCVYITALKSLGLTLEEIKPQENKLYAYKYKSYLEYEVRFFNVETSHTMLERAPEFDIDYTKKKIPPFTMKLSETMSANFANFIQHCERFINGEL